MLKVIESFIENLVEELKRENDNNELYEKAKIDVPLLIAPLVQNLSNAEYKEFIDVILDHEYSINYEEDKSDGYTNGSVTVNILSNNNTENTDACYWDTFENFSFKIEFGYDDRDEWMAPTFNIERIDYISKNSWNGSEQEFNDFKDTFYNINKELAEEKARIEKEAKIEYLMKNIETMQKELLSLQ